MLCFGSARGPKMKSILNDLKNAFESKGDPKIALQQKAYMRNQFDYCGLPTPFRRALQKEIFIRHPFSSERELVESLLLLWDQHEREYQYCAIDLAKKNFKLFTPKALKLFEQLIRNKSWWDTVDEIAIHLVGKILQDDVSPMDYWVNDPHLWIRRSSVICQINRKALVDKQRLFSYCRALAEENDFFIRKAIGWALRALSKHDPKAVEQFLQEQKNNLSTLSLREASKYI